MQHTINSTRRAYNLVFMYHIGSKTTTSNPYRIIILKNRETMNQFIYTMKNLLGDYIETNTIEKPVLKNKHKKKVTYTRRNSKLIWALFKNSTKLSHPFLLIGWKFKTYINIQIIYKIFVRYIIPAKRFELMIPVL